MEKNLRQIIKKSIAWLLIIVILFVQEGTSRLVYATEGTVLIDDNVVVEEIISSDAEEQTSTSSLISSTTEIALSETETVPTIEQEIKEDEVVNLPQRLIEINNVEDNTLQYLINNATKQEVIKLNQSYAENIVIPDEKEITIDLAGYTISPVDYVEATQDEVIAITVFGSLTIVDSANEGGGIKNINNLPAARGIVIASNGSVNLESGVISGFVTEGNGAGVQVQNHGTFSMNGGSVINNKSSNYGGGIFAYDGNDLILNGGEVKNNSAIYGGGVAINTLSEGTYNLNSAALFINDNSAEKNGGGFYLAGDASYFQINEVKISGNIAIDGHGGGIYFAQPVVCTIAGGKIGNTTSEGEQILSAGNTAESGYGGGIYFATGSKVTMTGGAVCGNVSKRGGGVFVNSSHNLGSEFTMTGGIVSYNALKMNQAVEILYGAGICMAAYSKFTIDGNAEISNNYDASYGGGIAIMNGLTNDINIKGGRIINNRIEAVGNDYAYGGGVYVQGGGSFKMNGGIIAGNTAGTTNGHGGGIYSGTTLIMEGGEISNNKASATAGGYSGTIEMSGNAAIKNNSCGTNGGGIYGTLTMNGGIISGNHAGNSGGAQIGYGLVMTAGEVSNNVAYSNGGAFWILGSGLISGGIISDNEATSGGAIYKSQRDSLCHITGTVEIVRNVARDYGGAIYFVAPVDKVATEGEQKGLLLDGGYIIGNTAKWGGGLFANKDVELEVAGSVIYDNDCQAEGGGADIRVAASSESSVTKYEIEMASNVVDADNNIYGYAWYDEINNTNIVDAIYSGDNKDAVSYKLLYKRGDKVVAEFEYNNTKQSFLTVQDAVNEVNRLQAEGITDEIQITMLENSSENVIIPTGTIVVLNLNGKTLRGAGSRVIFIEKEAKLTVEDETNTGKITQGAGQTNEFYTAAKCCGGVYVCGSFVLKGGNITSNNATYGAGVYVEATDEYVGSFLMEGGSISNNVGNGVQISTHVTQKTEGIIYAKFEMNNGEIKNNSTNGVVVYNEGSYFSMNGGVISGNKSGNGGGVYLYYSKMDFSGGVIENNQATHGGGIAGTYKAGLQMSGGTIRNNKATGNGGAVYLSHGRASFVMTGGVITGNEAAGDGGAFYGTYYDGYNYGTVCEVSSSAQIYGNRCNGLGNDIYAVQKTPLILRCMTELEDYNAWYESYDGVYFTEDINLKEEKTEHAYYLTATKKGKDTTEYVARIGDEESGQFYITVQAAINAASNGDEIYLLKDVTESAIVTKQVTIDLNGHNFCSKYQNAFNVSGENAHLILRDTSENGGIIQPATENIEGRAVFVSNYGTFTLQSGTIQGFKGMEYGGAVLGKTGTKLFLDGGTLKNNKAEYGGAISIDGSGANRGIQLSVKDTKILDNTATKQGGAIYISVYRTSATLEQNIFTIDGENEISGNKAENGGAIHIYGCGAQTDNSILTIGKTLIQNNEAKKSGGGIRVTEGLKEIIFNEGAIFKGNVAQVSGGAVCITSPAGKGHLTTINGGEFAENSAYDSGGAFYINGSVDIYDISIHDNNEGTICNGGGMYLTNGVFHLYKGQIYNNTGKYGGGLYVAGAGGSFEMEKDVNVHNNTAYMGGGLHLYNGSDLKINGGSVSNNMAYNGGAIATRGYSAVLTLNGALIQNNTAKSQGGGLYWQPGAAKPLTIKGGTVISGNNADTGGGIFAHKTSLIIDDSKINDNKAITTGGGIHAMDSTYQINAGMISNNTAQNGGGIYLQNNANLYNSSKYRIYGTLNGGEISNNTASVNGGGIYICAYGGDEAVLDNGEIVITYALHVNGGSIKDNSADSFGGGVYVSSPKNSIKYTTGEFYDNIAGLGQDIYCAYTSGSAINDVISLADPKNMFSEDDTRTVVGWYDENQEGYLNNNTDTDNNGENDTVYYNPVYRAYPLMLWYSNTESVARINNVLYTSVQEAVQAVERGDANTLNNDNGLVIEMIKDSKENVVIPAGVKVTLNLNGYTLKGNTTAITCSGELNIIDTHLQDAKPDGTGTITGHSSTNGGGILVTSAGKVTMSSGQISDCYAGGNTSVVNYGGGGVCVDYGTFILTGTASINNCYASHGAAVYVKAGNSRFLMNGGTIENNTSSRYGAVFVNGGFFELSNSESTTPVIKNNNAQAGGAIYLQAGKVNLSGGKIHTNEASTYGAGLFVNSGTAQLKDVEIYSNTVTAELSYSNVVTGGGGAIYIHNGTVNISSGTYIHSNKARRGAGIYQRHGDIKMSGGTITRNIADMGGGIAQYPNLRGKCTVVGGKIYGNISSISSAGNDIYSWYEGDGEYGKDVNNMPSMTLIPALDMEVTSYNVWRDDTYLGLVRVGQSIGQAQMITGNIISSNNLQLTAAWHDIEIEEEQVSTMYVQSISLNMKTEVTEENESGMVDGIQDGSSLFDTECAPEEITAAEMLTNNVEGFTKSTEKYIYNGDEFNMISYTGDVYKQGLYEQNQAVTWSPGNDSANNNDIVRTYDSIIYSMIYTVEDSVNNTNPLVELLNAEEDNQTVRLWMKAEMPYSSEEAEFAPGTLEYYIIDEYQEDGKTIQSIQGYWEVEAKPGTISRSITVKINGMKNGDTIKPKFSAWIAGNEENEKNPVSCESRIITVSAMPRYNILVMENSQLAYTGYFNVAANEEATPAERDAYKAAVANKTTLPENIVYGTMLGYGITLELYNDKSKGLMGIELPSDSMEFNMRLDGSLYFNTEQVVEGEDGSSTIVSGSNDPLVSGGKPLAWKPYAWAYKENIDTSYGTNFSNTNYSVNMNWNDEDDLTNNTQFAYDGAPFNRGGGSTACYSGGNWHAEEINTENQDAVYLKFKVSGYAFDTISAPSGTSDGKSCSAFNASYVKPFSAGYVQVLFPIDETEVKAALDAAGKTADEGYVEVNLRGIAYELNATSISGQEPQSITEKIVEIEDQEVVDDWTAYFPDLITDDGIEDYKKHAVREMRYGDNVLNHSAGMYIYGGPGEEIVKTNYFNNAANTANIVTSSGEGSTPIGSTVHIASRVSYGCSPIDPSKVEMGDQDYSQFVTEQEFNYVTAMNLLQKFDADAYTPVDGSAVQNVKVESGQSNLFGAAQGFKITTSETATAWSPVQTQSYELTILYAAKPDGSNWTKIGEGMSAGGERDMDAHREEDLIYFATINDLEKYFAAKEIDGKCIGILYQFRNCCLRSGRYFIATCKMQMSSDFEDAGSTFCITNDVRSWTTYRPLYKLNYHNKTLSDILYSFNWTDTVKTVNGVTVYGVDGSGIVPDAYQMSIMKPDEYDDGYIKTEYSNGHKVENTHAMGWYAGNTLLLYTLESSINIRNIDIAAGSNSAKEYYNISDGERTAQFEVIPDLSISSEVLNFGLKPNGKQATEVTITLDLPKHLNYDEGSMVIDYSAEDCDYEYGDLVWDIVVTKDAATGKTKIVLKTTVADIEKGLPRIRYTCTIGTPGASKEDDAKNGVALTTVATISATYEETNRIACNTKTAKVSITPLRDTEDFIYKQVGTPLLELGEDLVYYLNYKNKSDKVEDTIEMLDILPYNGDARENKFSGGYKIKEIQLIFEQAETSENFKTSGDLLYATDKMLPTSLTERANLLDEADAGSGWNKIALSDEQTDDTKTIFTYNMESANIIQTSDMSKAPAIYAELIKIAPMETVQIKITLTPQDNSTLISDANNTVQQGEDTYWNNFFYRSGKDSEAVLSNKVFIKVAERSLKGRVWMDQDQNGVYVVNTTDTPSTDETLRNVNVSLYVEATSDSRFEQVSVTDANGVTSVTWVPKAGSSIEYRNLSFTSQIINGVECIPAVDVLGNPVESMETDKDGIYEFKCLAEGTYYVTFDDDDNDYGIGEKKEAPLVFERLSVTPNTYTDKNQASVLDSNKSDSIYTTIDTSVGAAPLDHALISNGNEGIKLPPLAQIQTGHYLTNFWDCGLYYINYSVGKEWLNMTQVPDQTGVVLHLDGTVGEVTFIAPAAEYKLLQNDDQVQLTATGNSYLGIDQVPIVVTDENSVTWTVEKLPLQAEGAGGVIQYSFSEDGMIIEGNKVIVPDDYIATTLISTIDDTKETTFAAKNRKVTYQIQITKTNGSEDFRRVLEGATFAIYKDAECKEAIATDKTGSEGLAIFEFLEQGTYYLKETISPPGYKLSKAIYKFTITEDLTDGEIDDPEVTVTQLTDAKTGEILDPVVNVDYTTEFRDENMSSDTYGHTVGYTICIDFANLASPMLPLVGGMGTNPYIIGGAFGILATAVLLMYINKMRRREDEASS